MEVRPSEDLNIELYSENIRATVTKFGTKALCDVALHNTCSAVTFTQGQGQKGQNQMSPKSNIAIFLGNY